MLNDLFGNLQKQQAEIQQKLAEIFVEAETGDGAVTVKANANLQIESIKIDTSKLDINDLEQVEDLLIVAVNLALERAREKGAIETSKLLKGFLPSDMGDFMKP